MLKPRRVSLRVVVLTISIAMMLSSLLLSLVGKDMSSLLSLAIGLILLSYSFALRQNR